MSDTLKNIFLVLTLICLCFLIKCKLDSDRSVDQAVAPRSEKESITQKVNQRPKEKVIESIDPKSQFNNSEKEPKDIANDSNESSVKTKDIVPKKTTSSTKKKKNVKPKKKPIKKTPKPAAKIEFEEMRWDFGEITEGDIVKKKFKFTNTGNAPLQIIGADASCGCARPTVPFLDIAPGDSSEIGITYNSVSKSGAQEPEIIIESNTYPKHNVLKLFGTVKPKAKEKSDSLTIKQDSTVKN